ncbi:MAG: TonB-dependent receptor, partial [Pseudomonadales bacterium]|nr:TonB-dependent receptor [Pseudomonadales bacterium]
MSKTYSRFNVIALASLSISTLSTGIPIASAAEATLEEVVVTARRKEESLQETPVAVSAFNSAAIELRNIQSVADVTNFVPNVQFDSAASESGGGASSQISIRGIGQTDYAITVEPGVGLYLDGVYVGKSVGSLMDAVDLGSIEVLRGPQGTLFGKNTIGGAILLTSKKPSDEKELTIDLTVGEFDRRDLKLSGNLPVNDRLRIRASLASLNRDGHVDRILTGGTQGDKDALSGRIVADWDISETLAASLAVDATRAREESPGQVTVAVDENAFFGGLHNTIVFPACDPALNDPSRFSNQNCSNAQFAADIDDLNSTNTGPNQSDTDIWGGSLTLDWTLKQASIKSITAYRRAEVDVFQELAGVPAYQNNIAQDITLKLFSQEFQLSGQAFNDRLNYLIGLYYATEKGRQIFPVLLESVQFTSGGEIDNESKALFGQIGFDITDALTLTVGARVSDEEKRFLPQQQIDNVPALFSPFFTFLAGVTNNGFLVQQGLPLFPEVEVSRSDTEFTPSVTLDYRFGESSLAYASYSKGFKSGGFTMRGFPPVIPGVTTAETDPNKLIPSFGPETAEVFEVGLKSEFFNRRV